MQAALQGGLHDAFLGTNNSAKTAPHDRVENRTSSPSTGNAVLPPNKRGS